MQRFAALATQRWQRSTELLTNARLLRVMAGPPSKTVCTENYEAARKGTVTLTLAPCPGSLSNSNVPSNWSTRSRILISPSPPDFPTAFGVQPTPSSDTERQTRPSDRVSRTSTCFASEYLAALPSAS